MLRPTPTSNSASVCNYVSARFVSLRFTYFCSLNLEYLGRLSLHSCSASWNHQVCHAGPEWINFVVTLFLGAVPICIFFVFIAEEVIQGLGWIPVIAVAVLSIAMYTSLLLTGLLDPGIIPREEPTAQEAMYDLSKSMHPIYPCRLHTRSRSGKTRPAAHETLNHRVIQQPTFNIQPEINRSCNNKPR